MTVTPGRAAVIAHRGNSSVAPQNTLAAFEAAWRCGADVIELDLQRTADGHAVVIHDDVLDRTTNGSGPVAGHPLAAVGALDAGSWFAPVFAGHRVPSFAEVLGAANGWPGMDLLVELKGVWSAPEVARVAAAVVGAGLADRVVLQGFSLRTVAALAEGAPDLPRGLLLDLTAGADQMAPDVAVAELIAWCRDHGVVAGNPHGELAAARPDLVAGLRDAGLGVCVWTLDEPAHWAAALAAGVTGVISNRPDRLIGWLGRA